MYDSLIVTLILFCSLYECWILTKEYNYDEAKDLKKQRRTRTTKKTTTMPSGEILTEENTETIEQKGEGDESGNKSN